MKAIIFNPMYSFIEDEYINLKPKVDSKYKINNNKELLKFINSLGKLNCNFKSKEEYKKLSLCFNFTECNDDNYNKDNINSIYGLILDIDSGISIEEFKKSFGYECVIYTTTSHTEQNNRFRVCLLFNKGISEKEYLFLKTYFFENFLYDLNFDKSTFSRCRRFVIPYVESEVMLVNGRDFNVDLDYFIETGLEIFNKKNLINKIKNNKFQSNNNDFEKHLKNYINKVNFIDGSKHTTIVSIIMKFKKDYNVNGIEILNIINDNVDFEIDYDKLRNLLD